MIKDKLLVVVDMQNDFISGSLGSRDAQAIVEKVCKKIDGWDQYVAFTMDTHYEDYLETPEGKRIPVKHCINETRGWRLEDNVDSRHTKGTFVVYKDSFGSPILLDVVKELEIKEVQLVGVCTDICVVSNALLIRSMLPEVDISVDAACCAGTSVANHMAALRVMKACGIDIIGAEVPT